MARAPFASALSRVLPVVSRHGGESVTFLSHKSFSSRWISSSSLVTPSSCSIGGRPRLLNGMRSSSSLERLSPTGNVKYFSTSSSSSSSPSLPSRCLVAKSSPDFTADAVFPNGEVGKVTFSEFCKKGDGVLLLFYPLDFTFVCPSELLAFNAAVEEFKELRFHVLGVSVDSVYTHQAWMRTPPSEGGIGPLNFPLVSDLDKSISKKFDVLLNESVALRGLVIADKEGVVRHMTLNDLPLGRSVEEALRVCGMIKEVEKNGGKQVCPANWRKGQKMMKASFEGVKEYLGEKAESFKSHSK
ncbi:peroxiredoxin prx3 [Cystoisospora suis]|uniref:Peroxiredoxin prx3 n=1 Tax=Cystoisospora suis TaxID=483139 RepID=A0A2C6KLJ4_9APIC|nr:peroxiredoxin prx3 [Cystoisospora suis]